MAYDILVVGGGLIGMLTARNLQMEGYNVALVEKNKLGGAASWAAGGILSKLYPWQQSDEMQQLVTQGQASFPALVEVLKNETGIDAQLLQSGMLIIDVAEQQTALAWAKKNSTPIELLDRKELNQLEPNLDKKFSAALRLPTVMQVRPPLLIKAVHQSLLKHGVDIFEDAEVTQLVLETSKVVGVKTKQETMFAEQVILCNGAWTQQLLTRTSDLKTDIEPVRGQMLLFKPPQNVLSHIIIHNGFYLIPRQDQFLLCGSTLEYVGFSRSTTQEAKELLHLHACKICPALKEVEVLQHWSALRPGTARGVPYISAHPQIEALYINAGHFRYGIVTSIPSAKIASDLIANKANASQISTYAW